MISKIILPSVDTTPLRNVVYSELVYDSKIFLKVNFPTKLKIKKRIN